MHQPAQKFYRDDLLQTQTPNSLMGSAIAIHTNDLVEALKWLVALDGVAEKLLLLSASIDSEMAVELAREVGCDTILSRTIRSVDRPQDLAVVASLEQLGRLPSKKPEPNLTTSWILTTSGTTGRPKLIEHTLGSIIRTTKIDHARAAEQTWALLYDYTRFAGLQVVFQSLLGGAELVAPGPNKPLREQVSFFASCKCTHLSCTPTLWRKLLMVPEFTNLPLRQATLGGEIADDRVLSAIKQQFPKARVTHIYASTEAGVGFSVSDARAGFPTSFLNSRSSGIGIRLGNDDIMEIQSELSAAWINTGDRLKVKGDRVVFLGRDNGAINVGGDKVYPEEVEGALLSCPGVVAARVSGRDNAIVGALVFAEVQVSPELATEDSAVARIRKFISERLDRHKVPATIKLVNHINVSSSGKIERIAN